MQGPLVALGGDLGGDGVRMQRGEVLLSPPGAGKNHCRGGGQGGSWAGREPGAVHGVRRILSLPASGLPSGPEGPWVSPRGPVVPVCTFRLLLHHR